MDFPVKLKPILTALLTLALFGCGSVQDRQSSEENVPTEPRVAVDFEELEAEVNERPMSPEVLEKLLAAEFSGYRGDPTNVVDLYLKVARETMDPAVLERTVQLAIDISDLDRAMQAAVIWHETDPDNREARALAVQMLARNGEVEAAWFITEESNSPFLVRLVAAEAASTGNTPQILWLGQQIEVFGQEKAPHTDLYLAQAILLNQLEREEQAVELAKQALLFDSDNTNALILLAEILVKLQRDQEAAVIIENWLETNWERAAAERQSLLAIFLELNLQASDPSVDRLFSQFPESEQLLLIAAEIKINTRQLDAAETLYLRALELPEHESISNLQLGRIQHFRSESDLAMEYYAKVPPGVYYQYAQDQVVSLLVEAGRVEELVNFFAEQRAAHPDIEERLFVTQNQYLNALLDDYRLLDFLTLALESYPQNFDLLYARSLVAERMGRLDISEADLRNIIAQNENNSNALNALGYTLTNRTDRHAEAYVLIEKALSLNPESPAILDSMGWVLHNLGESEEALQYLIQAQDTLYDPEVISHHAEVLWHLNRTDEALDMIGVAMLEFPGNELLNDIRQRILDDLDNS
jgi:tetratricopeptide (TPR) repeat protein